MDGDEVRFYAEPGPLTVLPDIDGLCLDDLPTDRAALRRVVQGCWSTATGSRRTA